MFLLRVVWSFFASANAAVILGSFSSCVQEQRFEYERAAEIAQLNFALYSLSPERVIEHCGPPVQDFKEQLGQILFRRIRYYDQSQKQWEIIFRGPADRARGPLSLLRVGRVPATSSGTLDAATVLLLYPCLANAIYDDRMEAEVNEK